MSLSISILLSAILLSSVALYIATKDRWNWKKIILWPLLGIVFLSVIAGIGFWIYTAVSGRPNIQNEFWGISLQATKGDIKFLKGQPTEINDGDDIWVYVSKDSFLDQKTTHVIFFKGNKIRSILCSGSYLYAGTIEGLGIGSTHETIIKKFGEPSYISLSEDDLERIVSFNKYQVFFSVRENKVDDFGIFNPEFGPMVFKNEKLLK